MAFFRMDRSARLSLIGIALATSPGCYQSFADDPDDAGPGDADAPDVRDTEAMWEGVDPAPYPMCTAVDGYALTVATAVSTADYAEALVQLGGVSPSETLACLGAPCVTIEVPGGVGTAGAPTPVGATTVRFRYTYPALTYWDMVPIDIAWRVACSPEGTYAPEDREVTIRAWACRDDDGRILLTSDPMSCPMVVDCAPSPMARWDEEGIGPADGHGGRAAGGAREPASGGFRVVGVREEGGAWRLRARRPPGARGPLRWTATGGRLLPLSDVEALLVPAADRTVVVQVAAFTGDGVSIRVFRRTGA
jgi:hypothetical protein